MTPEEWARLDTLFQELSELGREERELRLLDIAAVHLSDAQTLRRMLRAEENPGFLSTPAPQRPESHDAPTKTAESESDAATPSLTDRAGWKIDEFVVIRQLGVGGMGAVYLAEDTTLHRRVALKVLLPQFARSPEALARFGTEARSAGMLKHPAIVPVFKFGDDGGTKYIASEYVEGPTLASVIQSEQERRKNNDRTVDVRLWHRQVAAAFIGELADALECSHRARIIHRDVKPSNILVELGKRPRLTDFGIAKHLADATEHSTSGVLGSCHYMSPEQAASVSSRVDERSDIFSLGVVLYQMLTLQLPFNGSNASNVLRALLTQEPAPVRSLDRRIAPDLATICHKAIEKDPLRRYQRAAHMAADLICWRDGRPILARPVGRAGRAWRWTLRHRRVVAAVGVAAAVSAAGSLVVSNHIADRSTMGRITVLPTMAGALVQVFSLAPGGLTPGTPTTIGRAPLTHLLRPGLYRIVLVFQDGSRREASSFVRKGTDDQIEVNPFHPELLGCELVDLEARDYSLGQEGFEPESFSHPRTVRLSAFRIGTTEITNGAYREYARHEPRDTLAWWSKATSVIDDRLPVVGLTWDQANRFCRWAGVRLPRPDEWEAAARSPDGRAFPWGDAPRDDVLKIDGGGDFDAYLKGAVRVDAGPDYLRSPLGLWHTCSNVQEYVEGVDAAGTGVLIKGRSFSDDRYMQLARTMTLSKPEYPSYDRGFRVAVSIPQEKIK